MTGRVVNLEGARGEERIDGRQPSPTSRHYRKTPTPWQAEMRGDRTRRPRGPEPAIMRRGVVPPRESRWPVRGRRGRAWASAFDLLDEAAADGLGTFGEPEVEPARVGPIGQEAVPRLGVGHARDDLGAELG